MKIYKNKIENLNRTDTKISKKRKRESVCRRETGNRKQKNKRKTKETKRKKKMEKKLNRIYFVLQHQRQHSKTGALQYHFGHVANPQTY